MHLDRKSSESDLEEATAVAKPKLVNFEPLEHKESSFARGKRPKQPGRIKVWTSLVSQHAAENSVRGPPTMARQCNFQQRQQSDAQISDTPEKKCEGTNRQVSPQLVTVCEGGRSIPSKCGSLKSSVCRSPFHDTWRKS